MTELTTVRGRVAAVNPKGVRLENEDSWRNVSKFAKPAPTMPAKGETVDLEIDASGFVRSIAPAMNGQQPAPTLSAPTKSEPQVDGSAPDQQRLIVRQSCLKTAVELLSTAGVVDLDEVLAVAAGLEDWVFRPA